MVCSLFRRPAIRSIRRVRLAPAAAETLEDRIVLSAAAFAPQAAISFDPSFLLIESVTVNEIEATSDTEIVADATVEGRVLGMEFTQDVQIPLAVEASEGLEASDVSIAAVTLIDAELTEDNQLVISATAEGSIAGEDFSQETETSLDLGSSDGSVVSITNVTVNGIEAASETELLVNATVEGSALGSEFTQDVQIPLTVEATEGLEASDISITGITVISAEVTEDGEFAINATVEGAIADEDFSQDASITLDTGTGDDDGDEDDGDSGTPGPIDALQTVLERLSSMFEERFDDEKFDKIIGRFADRLDAMADRFEEKADRRADRAAERMERLADLTTDRITAITDRATDRLESLSERNDELFEQGDVLDQLLTQT